MFIFIVEIRNGHIGLHFIACSANLPTGLTFLSFYLKLSKARPISGSTGLIFKIFFTKWEVYA